MDHAYLGHDYLDHSYLALMMRAVYQNVYNRVHTHTSVCTHIPANTSTHTFTHMPANTSTHTFTHVPVNTSTHMFTHTCPNTFIDTHPSIALHARPHMAAHVHTCKSYAKALYGILMAKLCVKALWHSCQSESLEDYDGAGVNA